MSQPIRWRFRRRLRHGTGAGRCADRRCRAAGGRALAPRPPAAVPLHDRLPLHNLSTYNNEDYDECFEPKGAPVRRSFHNGPRRCAARPAPLGDPPSGEPHWAARIRASFHTEPMLQSSGFRQSDRAADIGLTSSGRPAELSASDKLDPLLCPPPRDMRPLDPARFSSSLPVCSA